MALSFCIYIHSEQGEDYVGPPRCPEHPFVCHIVVHTTLYNITLRLSNLSGRTFLIRSQGQGIETINHWDGKVDVREKFDFHKDLKMNSSLVFLAFHHQIIAKESWDRKDPLGKTWGVMLCEMKGFDSFISRTQFLQAHQDPYQIISNPSIWSFCPFSHAHTFPSLCSWNSLLLRLWSLFSWAMHPNCN